MVARFASACEELVGAHGTRQQGLRLAGPGPRSWRRAWCRAAQDSTDVSRQQLPSPFTQPGAVDKVAVAVRVSEPLTPVAVNVYVRDDVDGAVSIMSVALAPEAGFGLKLALSPAAMPLAVSWTEPENPPVRMMFTV
jgi:hypothetical protein